MHRMKTLNRDTTALLVIDVQERINGVMQSSGHVTRIDLLAAACSTLGVPLVVTEQYPKGLGSTIPELAGHLSEPALVKNTFSCRRDESITNRLRSLDRRQLIVTGVETHVCVAQTVLDLLADGIQTHVPHDAVNSRRATDRDWALHRMAAAGATITSTESVLFELLERCGTDEFKTVSKLLKAIPVDN